MPQISADTLKNADLSGTSLGELNQDQLADINNLDWNQLGINIQDILNIIGEIPKEVQIQEIENAALPEFLKTGCWKTITAQFIRNWELSHFLSMRHRILQG